PNDLRPRRPPEFAAAASGRHRHRQRHPRRGILRLRSDPQAGRATLRGDGAELSGHPRDGCRREPVAARRHAGGGTGGAAAGRSAPRRASPARLRAAAETLAARRAFRYRVLPPSTHGARRAARPAAGSRHHHLAARGLPARLAALLQQRRRHRSPAGGPAAVSFWQEARRELGRETQPVDTVVRLIILERAIRGTLVAILGLALLTSSRGVVRLVRAWVDVLLVNPERRVIPRVLVAVRRPAGRFSSRRGVCA